MAPSKKSRSVSKKVSNVTDVSPKKDVASKNKPRKKKIYDKLGSEWSKTELKNFYEAYRKYGKDWKKVASAIRYRSVDMVEAVFTLNKAYLSLPEGTASVDGLIAMMTDYYSNQEGSDSEQETDDCAGTSRKLQKHGHGEFRRGKSKELDTHLSDHSNPQPVGCLPLLDERRSRGSHARAVGKRTPRVHVSHSYEKNSAQKYFSPIRHGLRFKTIANDDDVTHEIALALTGASQRGSPRVSQTPKRTTESPLQNVSKMTSEPKIAGAKFRGREINDVRFKRKRPEFEVGNNHLKDINAINARSSSRGSRKRSKKVLFGADEGSEFDALQALADLSVMMPSGHDTDDDIEKVETSATGEKMNRLVPGAENLQVDCDVHESKEKLLTPIAGMHKSRHKSMAFIGRSDVAEATDDVRKSASKYKRPSPDATHPKQIKMWKPPEQSSSSTDRMERVNFTASTTEELSPNQVNLSSRSKSKRKMDIPLNQTKTNVSENIINEQPRIPLPLMVSNCLSMYRVRRWCTYEWFYSAIDYPWFAKKDFVEYLDHVGLSHIPRLTRVEWGVIRSSLGKPRRFSQQFLTEEKEKLNQYRESVRTHYSSITEGLPADLAKPLSVGQRVIAIHPKTRETHDGGVLTVDNSRCLVQFDRPDLGVEFVKDIDCMPLNPWENIPASVTRHTVAVNNSYKNINDHKMDGRLDDQNTQGCMKVPSSDNMEASDGSYISPSIYPTSNLSKQIQSKEADVKALSQLNRALEKKEAVISEMRRLHDEVSENLKDDHSPLHSSESFKKQYATVLLHLSEVNKQVSAGLLCLRQRNTYQGNFPLMWMKPMETLGDPSSLSQSSDHDGNDTPKSGSNVGEIVNSSKTKAQMMVNTALQAIFKLKEGGGCVEMIEEIIDHVNGQLTLDESCMPERRAAAENTGHCSLSSQDQLGSCTSNPMANIDALDPKLICMSDQNETQLPSELIAHCVASMFIIQKCTEREFPPADVAKMIDYAVASLQPCSSQNYQVYEEIQKCMGIIRSQILALVPT